MDVEEIVKKYNIERRLVLSIVRRYESFENFKDKYVSAMQDGTVDKLEVPEKLRNRLIFYFDLSESDGLGKNNDYLKLIRELIRPNVGFIAIKPLDNIIDGMIDKYLTEREKDIVRRYYHLDGFAETFDELSERYKISKTRIGKIRARAVEKLKAVQAFDEINDAIICGSVARSAINQFVKDEEIIFYPGNKQKCDIKAKMCSLIIEKRIDELYVKENLFYIQQANSIEEDIIESELDEPSKNELLGRLKLKKQSIASMYGRELLKFFDNRIRSYDLREKMKLSVSELEFSERVQNCFEYANIEEVSQILDLSKSDLMKIKNLGDACINEITRKLANLGFYIPESNSIKLISECAKYMDMRVMTMDYEEYTEVIREEIRHFCVNNRERKVLHDQMEKRDDITTRKHRQKLMEFFEENIISVGAFPSIHTSVDELNFTHTTYKALLKSGICTVEQIIENSEHGLTKCIRKDCVEEILQKMVELGYLIPDDKSQTIKKYNAGRLTIHCKSSDIAKAAEKIKCSNLSEADRSYLLDVLLERAISNLKAAYVVMNVQLEAYYQLRDNTINFMELSGCQSDVEDIETKIRIMEEKKCNIESEIEEIKGIE